VKVRRTRAPSYVSRGVKQSGRKEGKGGVTTEDGRGKKRRSDRLVALYPYKGKGGKRGRWGRATEKGGKGRKTLAAGIYAFAPMHVLYTMSFS